MLMVLTRLQAIAVEAMLAGETVVSLIADVSIFTTTKPPYLLLPPSPLSLPNLPFCLCLCLTVTPISPVLSVLVSQRHSHISRFVCACVLPSLPYLPFCLSFVYCNTFLRCCFSFLTYPFSSAPSLHLLSCTPQSPEPPVPPQVAPHFHAVADISIPTNILLHSLTYPESPDISVSLYVVPHLPCCF